MRRVTHLIAFFVMAALGPAWSAEAAFIQLLDWKMVLPFGLGTLSDIDEIGITGTATGDGTTVTIDFFVDSINGAAAKTSADNVLNDTFEITGQVKFVPTTAGSSYSVNNTGSLTLYVDDSKDAKLDPANGGITGITDGDQVASFDILASSNAGSFTTNGANLDVFFDAGTIDSGVFFDKNNNDLKNDPQFQFEINGNFNFDPGGSFKGGVPNGAIATTDSSGMGFDGDGTAGTPEPSSFALAIVVLAFGGCYVWRSKKQRLGVSPAGA